MKLSVSALAGNGRARGIASAREEGSYSEGRLLDG